MQLLVFCTVCVLSRLNEAEVEMLLHTCVNNNSVAVIAQELKHSLKHTTGTTAAIVVSCGLVTRLAS